MVGLGCYALVLTLEIVTDNDEIDALDILVDALVLLLTVGCAVFIMLLAQRVHSQHEERMALVRDLELARVEGEAWRAKVESHLNGIRLEMERQFDRWGMTAAEKEVAMLILKGLSHKEVGNLRGTSEATARQQAQAVYTKARLPGKAAFSAYFLEDLMVGSEDRAAE